MRGLIVFILIVLIGVGAWNYFQMKRLEDVPTDVYLTIETFMKTTKKMSNLIWDEEKRDALKKDLEEWSKAEDRTKLPENFKEYQIGDVTTLFLDRRYGKAALTTLCFYEVDSFNIKDIEIETTKARANVEFITSDFLGLGRVFSKLEARKQGERIRPTLITFRLKNQKGHWFIDKLEGEVAKLIDSLYRYHSLR